MTGEERMNWRGNMREVGEEVKLGPRRSAEMPQPDSETKNDGEIKRRRLLHQDPA